MCRASRSDSRLREHEMCIRDRAGPVRMAVEDCASGRGLAEGYLALKEKGESWEVRNAPDGVSIARLAKEGDPVAQEAFRREGIYLGQAIAACCAVLDPEVVIIGGGLSLAFEHYREMCIRDRVIHLYGIYCKR